MQTAGIGNQLSTLQETRPLAPMASSTNQNQGSADSASIGANDFLTLLVTEMKNQDPTANTDPNEYVNQLVQVNSLQQLISINETLKANSSAVAAVAPSAKRFISSSPVQAEKAVPTSDPQPVNAHHGSVQQVSGNLSIPQINDAAVGVAHSLTTH